MPVFNVVRFRVRPGRDEDFLAAHRDGRANWPGLTRGTIIRTAERSYCLIGEWPDGRHWQTLVQTCWPRSTHSATPWRISAAASG
jgi:quinol monooxygenase YgiN